MRTAWQDQTTWFFFSKTGSLSATTKLCGEHSEFVSPEPDITFIHSLACDRWKWPRDSRLQYVWITKAHNNPFALSPICSLLIYFVRRHSAFCEKWMRRRTMSPLQQSQWDTALSWWFQAEINYHQRIVPSKQFKPRAGCFCFIDGRCLKFTLSASHPPPPPLPPSCSVLRLYDIRRGALQAFRVPSCTHPTKQGRRRERCIGSLSIRLHSRPRNGHRDTKDTRSQSRAFLWKWRKIWKSLWN